MNQYPNGGIILPEVCNVTNHEKSEKHQSAQVQDQARLNLNFEEIFLRYSCNSDVCL